MNTTDYLSEVGELCFRQLDDGRNAAHFCSRYDADLVLCGDILDALAHYEITDDVCVGYGYAPHSGLWWGWNDNGIKSFTGLQAKEMAYKYGKEEVEKKVQA